MRLALLLFLCPFSAFGDYLNCPCKVVKVSDGDTVHVLDQSTIKHKIRLTGIDAPEKKQAFGNKSKENLAIHVAGQNVEVEYNKKDRYGRIIGKLLYNDQDISLLKVKQALLGITSTISEINQRPILSSAEVDARERTIGLWAYPAI